MKNIKTIWTGKNAAKVQVELRTAVGLERPFLQVISKALPGSRWSDQTHGRAVLAAAYRIAAELAAGGPSGYAISVEAGDGRIWLEECDGAARVDQGEELKHAAMAAGFGVAK